MKISQALLDLWLDIENDIYRNIEIMEELSLADLHAVKMYCKEAADQLRAAYIQTALTDTKDSIFKTIGYWNKVRLKADKIMNMKILELNQEDNDKDSTDRNSD